MICVGVDAGGTATIAAASRDGVDGDEAAGGSANAAVLGIPDAAAAIVATIRSAIGDEQPDCVYVGAAGAARDSIASGLQAALEHAFRGARVAVSGDAVIALRAAIPAGDGVVLIAGTGSVAYAERGDASALVGGLGYLAGDEGSAFAIGMDAVKLYGRVLDGRAPRDEMTDYVGRALDAPDREQLLAAIYDAPFRPAQLAALAPAILRFADAGERGATKIVQAAGLALGDLVRAAIRQARLSDASPAVALAGGLFAVNSMLSFLLETRIVGDTPGATIVKRSADPVRGALRLAEQLRP